MKTLSEKAALRRRALAAMIQSYSFPLFCAVGLHLAAFFILCLVFDAQGQYPFANNRSASSKPAIKIVSLEFDSIQVGLAGSEKQNASPLKAESFRDSGRDTEKTSPLKNASGIDEGVRDSAARDTGDIGLDDSTENGDTGADRGEMQAGFVPEYKAPALKEELKPSYPRIAREEGYEGTVRIRADVDERGAVASAAIEEPSGFYILDKAAFDAVTKAAFYPATEGDKAVRGNVTVSVTFRLDDAVNSGY